MSGYRGRSSRGTSHDYGDHDDRFNNDYSLDNRRGRGGGRGRGRGFNKRQFSQDTQSNRGYGGGRHSRKSYQSKGRGGRGRGRGYDHHEGADPRSRLANDDNDGDALMDNPTSTNRHAPYQRQRPTRGGGMRRSYSNAGGLNQLTHGDEQWFRITIPYGAKASKDYIFKSIKNLCSGPFIPKHYHIDNLKAIFLIQGRKNAIAVRSVAHKITMPNGMKMTMQMSPSPPPKFLAIDLTEEQMEKLKVVMSNRYDPALKVLDLSNLYNDSELNSEGMYLQSQNEGVVAAVLKIVKENIPELEALDLSNNRLYNLNSYQGIEEKAPNIKCVHLKKNNLKTEYLLKAIDKLKIEELHLDGNPLCDNFPEDRQYVNAIRKIFPGVMKLDGHILPAPIKFALEANPLPEVKGSYFTNDEVKNLISMFLKQYIEIFDGDNRQQLMEAYHDRAQFSFSWFKNSLLNEHAQKKFNNYFSCDSRNLRQVKNPHKQEKALKTGKINIVAFLTELPSTQHDVSSLLVDVSCQNDKLLGFTVTGLFKERGTKNEAAPIRSFSRVFLTVPQGSGIVIINEQFTITNATQNQIKTSFSNPAPTPSSSPVLGNSGLAPEVLLQGSAFSESQNAMIVQFSTASKMNGEWSAKCLAQNEWNFDKAAQVFTDLQSKGAIPAEAFNK